jgi:hypothetical protein
MDPATYLAHLRREFGAFEACLAGELTAPVEHCGSWTLYDLADHLGQGSIWAAVAITDQWGDFEGPAAPRDRVPWRAGSATPAACCSPPWTPIRRPPRGRSPLRPPLASGSGAGPWKP